MSKYHAVRTEVEGITFASRAEAARYSDLRLLERSGIITQLVCQPKFPLIVNGAKICTYIADFSYLDQQAKLRIEDVKGVRTPLFSLKAKLFHALYKELRITEITR